MTVYCVDWYYDRHTNDTKRYYVMPHNIGGMLRIYFGFRLRDPVGWETSFYPWYSRFSDFADRIKRSHFTRQKAEKVADRLNRLSD